MSASKRKSTTPKYAVFYAFGKKIVRAAVEDGSVRDRKNSKVTLYVRSLWERSLSCPTPYQHPCCAVNPCVASCKPHEETREYTIAKITVYEKPIGAHIPGRDGLDEVHRNRRWQEGEEIENKDLWDWYALMGDLGHPYDQLPLDGAIIVDLA